MIGKSTNYSVDHVLQQDIIILYISKKVNFVLIHNFYLQLVSNPQSNKKELGESLEEEYKNANTKQITETGNVSETQKDHMSKANTPLVKRMKYVDSETDVRISNSTFDRLCSLNEKEKSLRKNR